MHRFQCGGGSVIFLGDMTARTNESWITELSSTGKPRDMALEELRGYLLKSLKAALGSWKSTLRGQYDTVVEDAVQEALLKILVNLDSFRGESLFTTWGAKIAVRTALTELRRKKWKDASLEKITEKVDGMLIDRRSYSDPVHGAMRKELMEVLGRIMTERLTERQRKAIKAVVFGGMPLEEAARRMDTNRNALYKLIHDARLKLKNALVEEGMTPADVLSKYGGVEVRFGGTETSL